MAKKPKVNIVTTEGVLKSVEVGIHKDKIAFESLSFTAEENEILTNIIKSEQSPDVRVTIALPGSDEDFPAIASEAILKSSKISKTCDAPALDGLKYSTDQISKLAGYVRSEAGIVLTIEQIQQELPLEG